MKAHVQNSIITQTSL